MAFRIISFLFTTLLIVLTSTIGAQEIVGHVKHWSTKEALPFASIAVEGSSRGVVSNENGEFIMNIRPEDSIILVSFVGFESRRLSVQEVKRNPEIFLKESKVELNEVVVGSSDAYLYNLFEKVRQNIRYSKIDSSRAYLKVQSDEKSRPIELIECYYNAYSTSSGISELKLKNGRAGVYLEPNKKYLSLSTSKIFSLFNLTSSEGYMPFIPFQMRKNKLRKHYKLIHVSVISDSISYIHFKPKKDSSNYFEGDVWINHKNYTIQKIKLNIDEANLFPLIPISPEHELRDKHMMASMTFSDKKLSHIEFNYSFAYNHGNADPKSTRYIKASGILYLFDWQHPFILPNYFYNHAYNDYIQISLLSYNSDFWKLNHGLPLTKIEKQKMAFFGQNGLLLNYHTQSDEQTRDKLGTLHSVASIHWRDSIRISLIGDINNNVAPRGAASSDILSDKYHIEVQLFLDINEVADSIQYFSATVFDVANTYYLIEERPFTDIFLNMYFDLCEIQRRKMVKQIEKGPKKVSRIKGIYKETLKQMRKNLEKYTDEIQHGNNIRKVAEYSKYIKAELGIDNVEMLGVGLD